MKPRIYAKATFNEAQLADKKSIGCDGIEIQLFDELIANKKMGLYKKFQDEIDVRDFLKRYDVDIIHSPLVQGDVLLEALVDSKDGVLLTEIFNLAQEVADLSGKDIGVIIHSESYYDKLEDEDKWADIVTWVGTLLSYHPNVYLLIENVSPFRSIDKGQFPRVSNNFGFDNVEMVNMLRKDTGLSRIYTCLDTAHALISVQCMKSWYDFMDDLRPYEIKLEDYFEKNKEVIGLIHLANIQQSGYGAGKHGVLFREDEYDDLCKILNLYCKYGYKCPITIEVTEDDYTNSVNYKMTKMLVDEYFNSRS